jgi:RNA polymerase sigma-70 factor, ECF subfamily
MTACDPDPMNPLIEQLRRRDGAAWQGIYDTCADAVFSHALYRLKGDRPTAEDVTQDVFMRAIESIDSYQGEPAGLLPWLRGIARRVIARRRRDLRPSAARPLSLDGLEEAGAASNVHDPTPGPDERLLRREEHWLTGAALTALPERWEHTLRWKYYEGRSVAEIAARLGVSPKAAESLLSRARDAFRAMYARLQQSNGRFCEIEEWNDE